jgi:hypothetical protein
MVIIVAGDGMRVASCKALVTRSSGSSVHNGVGDGAHAWAMVLAGGKGMRLRGLTRHVYGEDRPRRVIKTLSELGIQPAWLATLQEIVEGHESSLEPGADPILV